jgi:hypothetical protein
MTVGHRLSSNGSWRSLGCLGLLLGVFAFGSALGAERAKTDVITLQNGDRITGRILYVQFGYLQINSAHTGHVSVEWPSVRSIQSRYAFRVERSGGQHFAGLISTDSDGKNLIVGSGESAVSVPMQEVTRVVPYESEFWQRINGSVAVGYNFTKSSDVSQTSLDFNALYTDVALGAALGAHFSSTRAPDDNSSATSQITSDVFFLSPGPDFWGLLGALERDQNLGIDGRALAGAVLGRHLYRTSDAQVDGIAGVTLDQEWATGGGTSHTSVEAVFGGAWRVYKFSYPKVNLDASLLMYPSLTDAPRLRASLNVTLTFKLTDRFSLRLSEFGNYDSRPPAPNAQTLDYGITSSIAYDFGAVVP